MYFYRINDKQEIETGVLVPKKDKIREYMLKAFDEMPEKDKGLFYARTNSRDCFLVEGGIPWNNLSINDYFVHKNKINFNDGKNFHNIEHYPKTKYNMDIYETEVLKYCNGEYLGKYLIYVDNSNSTEYKTFERCFLFIDNYCDKKEDLWYLGKIIQIPEKLFWLDALLYQDRERFQWIDDKEMAEELLALFDFVPKFEPLKFDINILDALVERNLFDARLANRIKNEFDDVMLKHVKIKRKGSPTLKR